MTQGPFALVQQMAAIFDESGVPYALGGSMASSLLGEPRSTVDDRLTNRMLTIAVLIVSATGIMLAAFT